MIDSTDVLIWADVLEEQGECCVILRQMRQLTARLRLLSAVSDADEEEYAIYGEGYGGSDDTGWGDGCGRGNGYGIGCGDTTCGNGFGDGNGIGNGYGDGDGDGNSYECRPEVE